MNKKLLLFHAVVFALGMISIRAEKPTRPPNILFILTDDQGYGDLECNGHPFLKTPHMNTLRHESVRFENFHVAPSCSPTRAGLQSGMHEFKCGVTHTKSGLRQQMSHDRTTIGELLKQQGYATALFNKWHLGSPSPDKRGYDLHVQTVSPGPRNTMMYWDPKVVINRKARGDHIKDAFSPDILTNQLLAIMEDQVKNHRDTPFCYFFWMVTPHAPVMAPDKYLTRFKGRMTDEQAAYCAMIENIDDNVGRIMKKIQSLDIEEDTLVILMNDNGGTVGLELYNAGMRGAKTSVWPGGTRAFSYWRWPGTLRPRNEHALTGYVDVFPTLADIAGVDIPESIASELDGHSLYELLKSPRGTFPRDRLLIKHGGRWESGFAEQHKYIQAAVQQGDHLTIRIDHCSCKEGVCARARGVRSGRVDAMVYTSNRKSTQFHWAVTKGWELYNIKEDPACTENLSKTLPDLQKRLTQAYNAWWEGIYPTMIERGGDAPLLGHR